MLRLRPYKECDAQEIVKWIKSEFAFRQWSADRYKKYPVTSADINLYYQKDNSNPDIWGMTAFNEMGVAGHFTMRFTDDNRDALRLGFVIIDSEQRGKGFGKEMLNLAIRFAFEFVRVSKITLGVFENNSVAIQCYKSCGFKEVSIQNTESYLCMGETWNCIEMELTQH